MLEKNYTKLIWVIILSAVISLIPLIIYFWQFFGTSLSKDTITWGAFGSLVSGVFSMLSIAILSYTLLVTLRNNAENKKYYKKELYLSNQEYQTNKETARKEYIIHLITQHVSALNKKLDEKEYVIPIENSLGKNYVKTDAFLNFIEKKYSLFIAIDKINAEENIPCVLNEIIDCSGLLVANGISYYDEKITMINILNIISNENKNEFRKELISLFQSLTIARRVFWLLMYVSNDMKDLVLKNIDIILLPEVIKNSLPLSEVNNKQWQ